MNPSPLVAVGVVLVLAIAYLAAVETVLTRVSLVRALRLDEEERSGSPALVWLLEHQATGLSVVLLLTVVVRTSLAAVATVLGLRWLPGVGGLVVAIVVAASLGLVLGETAPRTVVLRHLEVSALRLAGSARFLVRICEPIARLAVALGRALVPRRHEVSGPYASDDELRTFDVDEEDADDALEPEERAMIRSIFELADTVVREIMVPRPDMVTVSERASLEDVIEVALDRGYSRLPVHDADDPDAIVGVVYAKDLLRRLAKEPERRRFVDLVRSPTFVPETKRCDDLLRDLQAAAVHLALVVDEYGELVGLVTIEDILEEIVGEIVDEHDHEQPLVLPTEDGAFEVDARLGVDDLNELLGAALPEDGWDTVGGLVFGTLGRVPREGEVVELDGILIEVQRVQGRRVSKVVVRPPVGADADAAAGGADGPDERGRATAPTRTGQP